MRKILDKSYKPDVANEVSNKLLMITKQALMQFLPTDLDRKVTDESKAEGISYLGGSDACTLPNAMWEIIYTKSLIIILLKYYPRRISGSCRERTRPNPLNYPAYELVKRDFSMFFFWGTFEPIKIENNNRFPRQ